MTSEIQYCKNEVRVTNAHDVIQLQRFDCIQNRNDLTAMFVRSMFRSQLNNHSKVKMQIIDIEDFIFVALDERNSMLQKWNSCDKCAWCYSAAKIWLHTKSRWFDCNACSFNVSLTVQQSFKSENANNRYLRHDICSAWRAKFNVAKMKFVWQMRMKLFNCKDLIAYKLKKVWQ